MDVREAYDAWSAQYDTNVNKTRDLEALALKTTLESIYFGSCLEIGCGTGKNTEWLITKAKQITAVDFSSEMLAKAREKITSSAVQFEQADITQPWAFVNQKSDLITFCLVLEHIEHLEHIFTEASNAVVSGGYIYIGELHPFKQYSGSKARFDTTDGEHTPACYTHHVSDFIQPAKKLGFELVDVNEYFDNNDRATIPRILTVLLRKL